MFIIIVKRSLNSQYKFNGKYKMKITNSLLAVFALGVIASGIEATTKKVYNLPPAVSEKILEEFLKCISNMGLDSTLVNLVKEGKYTEDDRVVEALVCSNQKLGYGAADGRLHVDKVMNDLFLNKPEIRSAMEPCEKDYDKSPKETFKAFLICFKEKLPVKVML